MGMLFGTEADLTIVSLLCAGLATLAGVVARLYFVQEKHAKRAADAYARLAVYLIQTHHQACDAPHCPLRDTRRMPQDILELVTQAAEPAPAIPHTAPEANP